MFMDNGKPFTKGYVGVLFVVVYQKCMQFDQYHTICMHVFTVCVTIFSSDIFWWCLTFDAVHIYRLEST